MKKVIVLFALIAAFAVESRAQAETQLAPSKDKKEQRKGRQKGDRQAAMDLKKELNLTTEQETKMKSIHTDYREKAKTVKADNTLDANQKKTKLADIKKGQDAEIKSVLNAEQYTKLSERKQQHKNRASHKGEKGREQGAMNMKKQLNLTSEQETKMKSIGDTYRGKTKAIASDNTLDKNQKREKFAEIQKAHDTEIKGVLKAEQYAKFTEIRKEQRQKMGEHKGHKGAK